MAYLRTDYQEVSPGNRELWNQFKSSVDPKVFPFPNLPYLQTGKEYISETKAIIYYLCWKHDRLDLLGKTSQDKIDQEQLSDNIELLRKNLF